MGLCTTRGRLLVKQGGSRVLEKAPAELLLLGGCMLQPAPTGAGMVAGAGRPASGGGGQPVFEGVGKEV